MHSKKRALVTISSALAMVGAATLPAAASAAVTPTTNLTPPGEVLIVDDDGLQCPGADFASVQAAIQEAPAGAVVQVCPGIYTAFVHIDKALTLIGQPEAVDALDCFDTSTSQAGDLDPTRYAILNRPQNARGNLITLAAGGVTVAGLVLQQAETLEPRTSPNIEDAAIHLRSGSAGARVHHNLIRLNGLGMDLGSDGTAATRVDHNCLRDNDFAMASQRQDFVGGTVDHNETFRTINQAYEVGWILASTRQSVFASNVSREDRVGFTVNNSSNVSFTDNDVEPVRSGLIFGSTGTPGSENITITDNRIKGGAFFGVGFVSGGGPSTGVVVSDNTITDFAPLAAGDAGFGIAPAINHQVKGLEIRDNALHNNFVGLSVSRCTASGCPSATSGQLVVRDNNVTGSLQQGIFSRVQVVGVLYEDNRLLGNAPVPGAGLADARDDNFGANTWVDNVCQTESTSPQAPPGQGICGVG